MDNILTPNPANLLSKEKYLNNNNKQTTKYYYWKRTNRDGHLDFKPKVSLSPIFRRVRFQIYLSNGIVINIELMPYISDWYMGIH